MEEEELSMVNRMTVKTSKTSTWEVNQTASKERLVSELLHDEGAA
jgi:hypothetical protein